MVQKFSAGTCINHLKHLTHSKPQVWSKQKVLAFVHNYQTGFKSQLANPEKQSNIFVTPMKYNRLIEFGNKGANFGGDNSGELD